MRSGPVNTCMPKPRSGIGCGSSHAGRSGRRGGNVDFVEAADAHRPENTIFRHAHFDEILHRHGAPLHERLSIAHCQPLRLLVDRLHQREQVFRRFFRVDDSRATPGSGLGLSLVQAVVGLHRAHIELADNAPGLRVTLSFGRSSQ